MAIEIARFQFERALQCLDRFGVALLVQRCKAEPHMHRCRRARAAPPPCAARARLRRTGRAAGARVRDSRARRHGCGDAVTARSRNGKASPGAPQSGSRCRADTVPRVARRTPQYLLAEQLRPGDVSLLQALLGLLEFTDGGSGHETAGDKNLQPLIYTRRRVPQRTKGYGGGARTRGRDDWQPTSIHSVAGPPKKLRHRCPMPHRMWPRRAVVTPFVQYNGRTRRHPSERAGKPAAGDRAPAQARAGREPGAPPGGAAPGTGRDAGAQAEPGRAAEAARRAASGRRRLHPRSAAARDSG